MISSYIEAGSDRRAVIAIVKGNRVSQRNATILVKDRQTGIAEAYSEHGYRVQEIAAHLGADYATVRRKLKKMERTN